ncbi:helix-turn-helix domain-containing protein [Saccharomonospora sp. NPDC046836]|uniref:helix-turn-helix domain-containing protein n=1 Tax=Saccharomonospora sp. NPDC046836 TaxID=3156921 RepID=UPI0033FD0E14
MAKERLTRQEQQQRNRVNLLTAAEKVFAERGIQGASLDEVAAEAGLTKGAVYSNFASKEELVLELMRQRMSERARTQAERLLCADRPAEELVTEFGEYWTATFREEEQQLYLRVVMEFLVHALRHPNAKDQLRELLFPPTAMERHPLVPPGSELAKLPPEDADTILKALEIGMGILALLDPEHRPAELFGVALELLAGMGVDESRIP